MRELELFVVSKSCTADQACGEKRQADSAQAARRPVMGDFGKEFKALELQDLVDGES